MVRKAGEDFYMTAEQAREYGRVDRILLSRDAQYRGFVGLDTDLSQSPLWGGITLGDFIGGYQKN